MPVGIDLGTAFSAIAGLGPDGDLRVHEVLPSVVTLLAAGALAGGLGPEEAGSESVVCRDLRAMAGTLKTVADPAGRPWTGEGLCRLLLGRLVENAPGSWRAGPAVLTVPPGLHDRGRRGLLGAARLAGLQDALLVEDGIAGAAAGSSRDGLRDEIVLVCNAGYSGFSATLVACAPNGIYAVAAESDSRAGACAMNADVGRLVERLVERDLRPATRSRLNMDRLGERLRQELSDPTLSVAWHSALLDGRAVDVALSQSQLAEVLGTALQAVTSVIEKCLAAAALPASAVHRVLLTGGGAGDPRIREAVAAGAGRATDWSPEISPGHAGALGAAAVALRLASSEPGDFTVRQAAPLDLGFRLPRGGPVTPEVRWIARRNAPLPAHHSQIVKTAPGETRFVVEVVQRKGPGDSETCAGFFAFDPETASEQGLEIHLGYDENGFIAAYAGVPGSGEFHAAVWSDEASPSMPGMKSRG